MRPSATSTGDERQRASEACRVETGPSEASSGVRATNESARPRFAAGSDRIGPGAPGISGTGEATGLRFTDAWCGHALRSMLRAAPATYIDPVTHTAPSCPAMRMAARIASLGRSTSMMDAGR